MDMSTAILLTVFVIIFLVVVGPVIGNAVALLLVMSWYVFIFVLSFSILAYTIYMIPYILERI